MATGLFNLKQVNQAISQGAWSGYIAPKWVEYLVVAGGGGGGSYGGGGAGGLLTGIVTVVANTSYTVTVGSGGSGNAQGINGVNSVFGSISTSGGGGGGGNQSSQPGLSGGSGGGAGLSLVANTVPGQGVGSQGNRGGTASLTNTTYYPAGGGGGAGTVGLDGAVSGANAGNGGAGIASTITGTLTTYAGGGGGGAWSSAGGSVGGTGGVGGGGNGGSTTTTMSAGANNTGGGGGGFGSGGLSGSNGGSGIVVVRYPGNVQFYTGGAVTYANGYIVHIFYASGTLAPTTPTVVTADYQISRSLRFNSADSAYLTRTPASASNQRTWTWSGWLKRSSFSTNQVLFGTLNSTSLFIYWDTGDKISITDDAGTAIALTTTAVYRDPSAWYHVVFALDTTQATASDRAKLYINGTQVTAFTTSTYPTQNATFAINAASAQQIGCRGTGTNLFLNGYMTEVNFIDGQALTPSSFGATNANTGVWSPKAYTGTYGTNGFYLNFSDNSNTTAATLGKDYSGNGNNWTPNNFSVTDGVGNDSLVDTPTSYGADYGVGGYVRGNYSTWNPLNTNSMTGSNGNLDMTMPYGGSGAVWQTRGSMAVSSGKWYFECTIGTIGGIGAPLLGVCTASSSIYTYLVGSTNEWLYYGYNGNKYNATGSSYGATWGSGDVIGVAFDMDAGTITFYKNGASQGVAFTNLSGKTVVPCISTDQASNNYTVSANFGQRTWAYAPPGGFKALVTQNLPNPTIGTTPTTLATNYFTPVLYTGNGSARSITGVGFQPDFTWIKARSVAYSHRLADSVRGVGKELYSDDTAAETTNSANGYVTSFNSDGFSLGTGIGVNANTQTFVAWNWKANGSSVSNTAGSITSTVSANTTSGFSVVTYTGNGTVGATVGHGLGVAPSMMFIKGRTNVDNWHVYSSALGNTGGMFLNLTNAFTVSSFFWNNTSPSSTAFTLSSGSSNNSSGVNYVAYCFAPVAGYSAFGSYTGNGSTDGPFCFTGMRPAYILVKCSSTTGPWDIFDDTRSPTNVASRVLYANTSSAEGGIEIDILSNGFKIRDTSGNVNTNGATYIFMALAENPFKYSLAR